MTITVIEKKEPKMSAGFARIKAALEKKYFVRLSEEKNIIWIEDRLIIFQNLSPIVAVIFDHSYLSILKLHDYEMEIKPEYWNRINGIMELLRPVSDLDISIKEY